MPSFWVGHLPCLSESSWVQREDLLLLKTSTETWFKAIMRQMKNLTLPLISCSSSMLLCLLISFVCISQGVACPAWCESSEVYIQEDKCAHEECRQKCAGCENDDRFDPSDPFGRYRLALHILPVSAFSRASPLWTNDHLYRCGGELKTAAFFHPTSTVLLRMTRQGQTGSVTLPVGGKSLMELFNEPFSETRGSAEDWNSLVKDAGRQPSCNKQGFNVQVGAHEWDGRMRLGIFFNEQNDCTSCDSGYGIGHDLYGAGARCKWDSIAGYCSGTHGQVKHDITAEVYVESDLWFELPAGTPCQARVAPGVADSAGYGVVPSLSLLVLVAMWAVQI
eukprot:TRINITY_DN6381_c0_g1_i4.p1 TRINITY_DN6381_c0_g1~~TRINITY_DN6381_c0_g1_i4.p1  ORF type:complete len:357 (-),score=23.43 TRINITY_DN6381_c0_g1_i4:208-1212(-)